MDSERDTRTSGSVRSPKCEESNPDSARRRVCACAAGATASSGALGSSTEKTYSNECEARKDGHDSSAIREGACGP
jgi:hypothetical protein